MALQSLYIQKDKRGPPKHNPELFQIEEQDD